MNKKTLCIALTSIMLSSSAVVAADFHNHDRIPEHLRNVETGVDTSITNPPKDQQVTDSQTEFLIEETSLSEQRTPRFKLANDSDSGIANVCVEPSALASVTGQARINLLQTNSDFSCFEDKMWAVSDNLKPILFDQSSMISFARHARQLAITYDGTNSNGLRSFINYLRVGFWAKNDNRGAGLTAAMQEFLDELYSNPNYYTVNEVNGFNVKEAMILMYIESWRSRYINAAIGWLPLYEKTWGSNLQRLLTHVLTLSFRGASDAAFKNAVELDRGLVRALNSFLLNNDDLIGHQREYHYNDTASELARLLGVGGQTYQEVKVLLKDFMSRYDMTSDHGIAWLNMAARIDTYDKANCAYYGSCNYKQHLESILLSITHNCSESVRIRAQELTSQQLSQICEDLAAVEVHFHQKLSTNFAPVSDDNNTTLEMIIYNSSKDYKKYSGILFNHSTNNGGIYLEGNPSVPGNIPRFMAHEAEWLPDFTVWNLEHEYVHYLDGRFNKYGSFSDGYDHKTVWWSEGLAEYISKKNRNDDAITEARKDSYNLSQTFSTTYDHNSTRIYDWGYLATRFMFEEKRSDVNNLLNNLRVGQYVDFDNTLGNLGPQYQNDFSDWLKTVESTDSIEIGTGLLINGQIVSVVSDGSQLPSYYIDLPQNSSNLVIKTTGGTAGDADLHVKYGSEATTTDYDYRPWRNGSNETVSVAQPAAGRWYIMVSPYGGQALAGVTLTASWTESATGQLVEDTCKTQSPVSGGRLVSGKTICLGATTTYLSIWVPAGKSKLTLASDHGEGDLNIYAKSGGWPTTSNFDYSSNNPGVNAEQIEISNPAGASWHYFMITGQGAGASLFTLLE